MTALEKRVATLERTVEQLQERLSLAFTALSGRQPPEWRPARPIEAIMAVVCAEYDVSREQLLEDTRITRVVEPRHVAMFLARTLTGHSLSEIGRSFGDRDHGTVLHAVHSIANRLDTEPEFRNRLASVREGLKRLAPEIVKAA